MAKIETVEQTTTTNNETNLMQLIQDMQAQIDKLSAEKWDTGWLKKEQEHYQWPLHISYKIWDNKPILSYRSERKDTSKPLRYRMPNGEYVSNHFVVLTLADGNDTKAISAYDFWMYHTQSDKIPCGIISKDWYEIASYETKHIKQGIEVESYVFNTKEYGKIIVSPNCIN